MKIKIALCSCLLAAAPSAQTTWIVDASQGPGTNFTDIQPAIDAAVAGDIISIRSGSYSEFSVGKPLAIQGVSGVVVDQVGFGSSAVTIRGLGAGETLSIHRIAIDPPLSLVPAMRIIDNSGRVVLQQIDVSDMPVEISRSETWLTGSQLTGLTIRDSRVVIADSESTVGLASLHAVTATDSTVSVSRCTFVGADANVVAAPGAGFFATNASMTFTDDGTNSIRSGFGGLILRPAIDGTGALLIDPNVVLNPFGLPAISPAITTTTRSVPSVRVTGGALGGTIDIDVFSPANGFYELFVGLPATPTPFLAFGGDLALGTVILSVQAGVQTQSRHTTVQIQVGNNPAFTGVPLAWQALGGFATGLYLSTPDVNVIHP